MSDAPAASAPSLPPAAQADLDTLLGHLRDIAERAGAAILGYYGGGDEIAVTEKADHSPLTQADLAADRLIVAALRALTPAVPVISEEGDDAASLPSQAPCFWLVDPLDGTKEFISRNGEFTVNIALVAEGQPVAGVVHAPALARTWSGGVAADGARIARVAAVGQAPTAIAARAIPDAGAVVVASRRHGDPERMAAFLGGRPIADTRNAGSSIKFCLLATGEADIYPRFGRTMEWDTGAGHALLRAAGGRVETVGGEPLTYGKPGFENPEFVAYGRTDG